MLVIKCLDETSSTGYCTRHDTHVFNHCEHCGRYIMKVYRANRVKGTGLFWNSVYYRHDAGGKGPECLP